MLPRELIILTIFAAPLVYCREKEEKLETYCNINGKKVLHCVSDKFLSISIDPAVLLSGINLSDTSLRLAKQLSPAYIRIAGPSTKFVKYVDNEYKSRDRLSEDGNNVVVTPSMWFGINEWLSLANLTPVFGINDIDTDRGVWNPKSAVPLLEISDKLNVTCYWQLGFDSSQKSVAQYKQDLNLLHLMLAEFPGRNESWKIVGSDISNIPSEHAENVLGELKDITTAIMWEPSKVSEESFPEKDWSWKILQQQQFKPQAQMKIWTTVPKSSDPVSFSSTMLWASQIGNAAKFGYDVVFRQPGLHEMFSDTPVYWFSLLHKKLMGNNVLDTKTTALHPGCLVYAHCTAKENHFLKQGAVTLMIINKNVQSYKVKVKLGRKPMEKTMELQSYVLTAPSENSTEIYLNGNKLTSGLVGEANSFEPKVRQVKSKPHISLELPPLSIGFFVLPNTRLPVCINSEKEINVPVEPITQDQSNSYSQESSEDSFGKTLRLEHITENKKDVFPEIFPNANPTFKTKLDLLKQLLQYVSMYDSTEDRVNHRGRKFFSDRAKANNAQEKMQSDPRNKMEVISISHLENNDGVDTRTVSKSTNLNLTSEEVEKILRNRAEANKVMKNVMVTEEEIRIPIEYANMMFLDSKLKDSMPEENLRLKRDINMQLLERQGILGSTSAKYSNDDYYDHKSINDQISKNKNKRTVRQARDVNMKLLDIKSKLEDNRQRMEDKKYEIVGYAQSRRNNIKDKISKLRNKKRFKRDINMDLLKIKSDVQKKKSQKEERKSFFADREEKTATIRKPGQTSEELLAELEEEEPSIEEKNIPAKVDVYAELALPEYEKDMDYMNENVKPKRPTIFDKKSRGKLFGSVSKVEVRSKPKPKKNKEDEISEDIQFLTTSEEFTDIEDDYPCIHEYFGPQNSKRNHNRKQIMLELGENEFSVRKPKNEKTSRRKMTELTDMMNSEESDSLGYLRKRRNVEQSDAEYNKNYIIELGEVDYFNGPIKKQKIESQDDADGKLPIEVDAYVDETYLNSPRDLEIHHSFEDTTEETKALSRELVESTETDEDEKLFHLYQKQQQLLTSKTIKNSETIEKSVDDDELVLSNRESDAGLDYREDFESGSIENKMTKDIDNEGQLRGKRDLDHHIQEDANGKLLDIKNYLKDFEKETKHNLEELARIMSKYTSHGDMTNKLTPMQFKDKSVEGLLEKAKSSVLDGIQKTEKENSAEMPVELELLKEYLTHSKNEIDKLLSKEFELYKKIEEGQQNMIRDILQQEHENSRVIKDNFEKVKIPEKEIMDINVENANLKLKNQLADIEKSLKDMVISGSNKFQFMPTAQLVKRSIFDNTYDIFGNYKPLTTDLKPWKPSDILSLKRDVSFLTTPKLNPITDPQILKNMFDKNSYFNMRTRRNIDDNHLDNDIGVFMNEIEQDDRYKRPKLNMEVDDYKLMLSSKNYNKMSNEDVERNDTNTEQIEKLKSSTENDSKDNNKGTHKNVDTDLKIKSDIQGKSQVMQEETTTIDPIIYYTFNDDFEKEIESDPETTTESMNVMSAAVYRDIEQLNKQEPTIFQNLVSNVTGFFTNIGRKIGHYMKEIGLK